MYVDFRTVSVMWIRMAVALLSNPILSGEWKLFYLLECKFEDLLEQQVYGEFYQVLPYGLACVVDISFVYPCVSKCISHKVCSCSM